MNIIYMYYTLGNQDVHDVDQVKSALYAKGRQPLVRYIFELRVTITYPALNLQSW